MNPRAKHFLAVLVVVLGAVIAWRWFGPNGIRRLSPAKNEHAHGAPGTGETLSSGARPAPLTSSVTAGTPLVRTESAPPTAVAEAPTSSIASRPESQPEARADLESVRLTPGVKEIIRVLLDGSWETISRLRLSAAQGNELQQFLHGYLIFHLGRLPKGRDAALKC